MVDEPESSFRLILERLDSIEKRLDSIERKLPSKEKGSSGQLDEQESTVKQFVEERCLVASHRFQGVADMYSHFATWCLYHRIDPVHINTFGRLLRRCFPELAIGHKTVNKVPVRHYFGIGVQRYWAGDPDNNDFRVGGVDQ